MNAKKKLLFSFAGLILSIAIFSTVVFAWFAINSVSSEFIVETGVLETDTDLYHRVYDSETDTYKWNIVNTKADANYIFNNIVPGQVVTFKLQLSNCATSSIKANYTIKIGEILFGDEDDENLSLTPETQHLLNAIHIKIDRYTETVDDKDVKSFAITSQKIDDVNVASEVVVDDDIVNTYEIAYKKGDPNEFKPLDKAKQLSQYLGEANKTMISSSDTIAPGTAAVYIIRIYFNPLFGIYNGDNEVSNSFMKQKFHVEHFRVDYTQEKQITE